MSRKVAMSETALTAIAMLPNALLEIKAARETNNALISAVKALAATAWRSGGADGPALRSGLTEMATKSRPTSAAPAPALATKKLKGLCVCVNAVYGNAASRLSETVPSDGAYAYGGYPDVDALYTQQARETDPKRREAQLRQIQQLLNERVRFAPIYDYIWPSAVGPRVEEPALMLINPYPWSAPLEEVRLKKK